MSPKASAAVETITPAEYLALERSSPEKHEYFGGEIFAMAGASEEHNLIVGNLVGELRQALRQGPCRVYPSDMRVKVSTGGLYTYPDVIVVCSRPEFEDEKRDTLTNPEVLVEVLSDSSERYDRGRKFEHYRKILSLQEYILVSQDQVLVEQFTRKDDGSWGLREHRAGGRLWLASIGCELLVDEVYLKVFSS
ncbi:Uma2 family endonuclease [Polyangium aurulentum]|uniref:Uma2 family endonuclease n=1 Tax=Polyangium aurulentum TaxID=2567896 RepID=UPI0010AE96AA|nr:Uma2 family endonuclease [Polyangium aurulentum]UQA61083.1 Uma2 family endonuclease [Polyangium aurulentum]